MEEHRFIFLGKHQDQQGTRNIMKSKDVSAFSLIIDHNIIEHIRKCMETGIFRVFGSQMASNDCKIICIYWIPVCTRRV